MASSSQSNTLAGPLCCNISGTTADLLTTDPSGARLPLRTASPPVFVYGLSIGLITSGFLLTLFFTASPSVRPVTVIVSPLISPASRSSLITAYTPPASFKSSI